MLLCRLYLWSHPPMMLLYFRVQFIPAEIVDAFYWPLLFVMDHCPLWTPSTPRSPTSGGSSTGLSAQLCDRPRERGRPIFSPRFRERQMPFMNTSLHLAAGLAIACPPGGPERGEFRVKEAGRFYLGIVAIHDVRWTVKVAPAP